MLKIIFYEMNQKLDLILEPKVGFNICAKKCILRNESKVGFNIGIKNWI